MGRSSIEGMIEHQIRRWEVERRGAGRTAVRPCIAISRLAGSGGDDLAGRLAERLGYALFDRQIVEAVAQRAGVSEELVEGLDEHVRSAIERTVVDAFSRGGLNESEYLRHLVRVVTTLGERGGVVLLGRGAASILSPERALRVFLAAPREMRIARVAEEKGLAPSAAAESLDRADRERRDFLRHHFSTDPWDPAHYDLCLNLGTLSPGAAESLVLSALQDRFPVGATPRESALF